MSKLVKVAAATVAAAAALTSLTTCSSGADRAAGDKGSVYYLSFRPGQDQIWQDIAKAYAEETDVEVKVIAAAFGTYEQTLKPKVARSDAPTLFQINGPVGLKNWVDYTADLSEAGFYKSLLDPPLAVTKDRRVYGVPYVVESYGIIYNQKIMDKYFALGGARVKSMDEITNFDTLRAVADDMQAKKGELSIEGVFASTSLKPGEDWCQRTRLADFPVYFEYQDARVENPDELKPTYNEQFKNIFDLHLTDSTTGPKLASSKVVTDSMVEFALGKTAMVQSGNWAFGQISEVADNIIAAEDVRMLPIYTDHKGEEKQGLNIDAENYFSINFQASETNQRAFVGFVSWLVSSEKGKKLMVEDLGFIPPFNAFTDAEQPSDPFAQKIVRYMSDSEKKSIPWVFITFPSQTFREGFGVALSQYTANQVEWNKVVEIFTTEQKAEKGA